MPPKGAIYCCVPGCTEEQQRKSDIRSDREGGSDEESPRQWLNSLSVHSWVYWNLLIKCQLAQYQSFIRAPLLIKLCESNLMSKKEKMSTASLFSLSIEPCINSITIISVAFTLQPNLLIKQVSKWVNERGQVLYLSHIVQRCYIQNFTVMASILQYLSQFS